MKFVADEGVDAPIVLQLRKSGHDVWYVAEMAAGTDDESIPALARSEGAVLITADKDFGALVYQKRQASAGVVLLRLAGLSAHEKIGVVDQLISEYGNRLPGAFAVVSRNRIRIRPGR